ncbi:MAG: PQQ-binding-like beta-propeller repeat protein [Planctomycetaceae bacterium]
MIARRHRIHFARSCLALLLGASAANAFAQNQPTSYEQTLTRNGVSPDVEGVRRYVKLLTPTEAQRRKAVAFVSRLGAAEFRIRESATRALTRMPHPPTAELDRAALSRDPEVRWRAKLILRKHKQRDTPLLHAVLAVVEQKPLTGLTREVLATFAHLEKPYGTALGTRALLATAGKDDAGLLRDALRSDRAVVRAAAVKALSSLLGGAALKELRPILVSARQPDEVRLAAARAFADAGRREALDVLVRLMASREVSARAGSAVVLRALTGRRFAYAAYDNAARRAASLAKWKSWLRGEGRTAALKHPLKLFTGYESFLNGHTLISCGYRNKVVELDAAKKEVWNYAARGAFGAEKLPNGNVLISCYGPNEVIEVTPAKKVVWRMKVPSCLNARLLGNGNVLVACHTGKQVWEVSRDKRIVWKYQSRENCYDAHRLPNGNTMVSSDKGVIEVTPAGKTVWEHADAGRYYGFQPLPNGNLLLAGYSSGKVVEITRDKKIVWTFKERSAFDAFRLENGNTLIASTSRVVEVTPEAKIVWTQTGNQHGRARR